LGKETPQVNSGIPEKQLPHSHHGNKIQVLIKTNSISNPYLFDLTGNPPEDLSII